MAKISELQIKIKADASEFKREMKNTQSSLKEALSPKPINDAGTAFSDISKKAGDAIGKWKSVVGLVSGAFGFSELISSAAQAGEATYMLSSRLGMTAAQAGQLKRVLSLTGGDANSCASAIMRLDKSFSTSGKAGEVTRQTLEAYGVSLTDANGKLLSVNQQLENLAKGYQLAKQSGQEQEYLMSTLGVRGMALAQTLDQYAEASKTAAKVQGIGLNPQEMHEISQQMKVMQMEAGQLNLAFTAALAPVAQEVFPPIIEGLKSTAKFLADNKTEVRELAELAVKLYGGYKLIGLGKGVTQRVQSAWSTVSGAMSAGTQGTGQQALSTQQEKLIEKTTLSVERSYERQKQAAIKAAMRMNLSAEETATVIATKMQEIEIKSNETATRIAERMRAGFLAASQAATASSAETRATLTETAITAETAATRVAGAHATEAESAQVAVAAEKENAASHGATALAAEAAATRVAAAHAASAESAQVAVAAQGELTAATAATGEAATVAGAQGATAAATATKATAATTGAQKVLAGATKNTGNQSMITGGKFVAYSSKAGLAVKGLTSLVWALAGGWVGVALAIAYAAYCLYQFTQKKMAERDFNTYKTSNGSIWHHELGTDVWERDASQKVKEAPGGMTSVKGAFGASYDAEKAGFAAPATSLAEFNRRNAGPSAEEQAELDQQAGEKWLTTPQGIEWSLQQKVNSLQDDLNVGTVDYNPDLGGGGGAGGASESAKQETPMRTKYSFEDGVLAPYANEIIYTANQWGYDPRILASLILARENKSANPTLWSSDGNGNYGLTQISQDIANRYAGGKGWGDNDWASNIWAGGAHLGDLISQYHDVRAALLAYNAGVGGYEAGRYDSSYASDIINMAESMSTSQVPADSTSATPTQTVVQVPIGYDVVDKAEAYYNSGYKDELSDRCADFVSKMYVDAGVAGIEHVDSGSALAQKFKDAGAYHSADSGYTPQIGDLIDWEGHVGIYTGNGQYIARNTHVSNGDKSKVHMGPVTEGESWGYGKLLGYGSVSQLTGGQTVSHSMSQGDQAVMEALKKQQELIAQKNQLMEEMQNALINTSGTAYQKDFAKLESDLRSRAQKINKLAGQGVDVSDLQEVFQKYTAAVTADFAEKWQGTFDQFRNETRQIAAQARHDYEEAAQAEYEETLRKLDKERKEKEKALMKDENDSEMRNQITDWYYAKRSEAEEKLQKTMRESHEKYLQYLEEEGNLAGTMSYLNSSEGRKRANESLDLKGQQSLAKEYATIWEAASGDAKQYVARNAASVSNTLYGSMTDDLSQFIQGTITAKQAFRNFGNSVLNMMAKMSAQWLAAKWMTGILNLFGGSSAYVGAPAASGLVTGNFSNWVSPVSSFSLGSTAFEFAGGGYISGKGTGTSDDIPAWLSNGEYVMTAAATKKYQPLLELMNAEKFATGGLVAPTAPSVPSLRYASASETASGNSKNNTKLTVNLKNESGSQLQAEQTGQHFDGDAYVVDVVLRAVATNRSGIRSVIKGVAAT